MSPTYTLNEIKKIRGPVDTEPPPSRISPVDPPVDPPEGTMPLSIKIHLGPNTFEAEGDFEFNAGFHDALRQFINAIADAPNQLEAVAEQLESQTAALAQAVSVHQPPTEQEP